MLLGVLVVIGSENVDYGSWMGLLDGVSCYARGVLMKWTDELCMIHAISWGLLQF